jgi:SAM-dependent methyltransferase
MPGDARGYAEYYREAYKPGHCTAYDMGVDPSDDSPRAAELRAETRKWLEATGVAARVEARVLELGCGLAQLRDVHPGWIGLEFSETAVQRVHAQFPHVRMVHGDMQAMPFEDEGIDCLFSWAAIEHVPHPEQVMAEIARVLAPGGVAILAPAWNCRSWTVKRLQIRRYRDLSVRDAFEKATIPLRNTLLWRGLAVLPRRLAREVRVKATGRPCPFDYVRLYPDLALDLPHITDDDAQANMDPHAAVLYFRSRGWDVLSHEGLVARLAVRTGPVVVRKPHPARTQGQLERG